MVNYVEQGRTSLLAEKQAATFLGLSPRTLQAYRVRGSGPEFIRISARCIRYRVADLMKWIDTKTVTSTSGQTI